MRCWIIAFLVVVAGMSGCKKGDGNVEPSTSGKKAPVVASDAAKPASEAIAPGPTMLERVRVEVGACTKGRNPFLGQVEAVEQYTNAGLEHWFAGKTFYRVRFANPKAGLLGPAWTEHVAAMAEEGKITCVDAAMSTKLFAGMSPKDAAEALLLAQAWGTLVAGGELASTPPVPASGYAQLPQDIREPSPWPAVVTSSEGHWQVDCVFVTDVWGGGCSRMNLTIGGKGSVTVTDRKYICGPLYE